ncbi:MAG: TetR/AcrR family transcriptional regulator [Gammaproteobacteria bacterium]|nr:TetR/AcrR family transcriptional regulator [Gammaproteobacteria bacterium]
MERGRPRTFDKEKALEAALAVFWRSGYQGASLAELTQVMGISKPSLYAAFGNKEQLYLSALKRYREKQLDKHARVLAAETDLKPALRRFLRSVASMLTAPELPGGCMVVTSAVACDTASLPQQVIAAIGETVNQSSFDLLRERLKAELAQRTLPADLSAERLADYFATIMAGMAVVAKVGISKKRLFATIDQALCVIPD